MSKLSRRGFISGTVSATAALCLGGRACPGAPGPAGLSAPDWIELFDGKTLNGWHKNLNKIGHGTGGSWTIEPGGILAGEQDPPGSGNGGILLTDRKFGDFELSLDMKPAWGCDSGVFIRGNDLGQCIQMTVDYYNGGNIGHFYGEATGGWVARSFSLEGVEEDGKLKSLRAINVRPAKEVGLVSACTPEQWLASWKVDDWNSAVVRVEGGAYPRISTSINGLEVGVFDAAKSDASMYNREQVRQLLGSEGSIAVQVHGGTGSWRHGSKGLWRNIRIRPL